MGQVIIYYWSSGSSIRKISHLQFVSGPSFGHVAIKIIPDEAFPEINEYISFWPGDCYANNQSRIDDAHICRANQSHFHTKDQDDYLYQDKLPDTLILTTLDTEAIIAEFRSYQQSPYEWRASGSSFLASEHEKNCVGLSVALLNKGGLKTLTQTYYHLGILSGGLCVVLPTIGMVAIYLFAKAIGAMDFSFLAPDSSKPPPLVGVKEVSKGELFMGTFNAVLGAIFGTTLGLAGHFNYNFNKKTTIKLISGVVSSVLFSILTVGLCWDKIFYVESDFMKKLLHLDVSSVITKFKIFSTFIAITSSGYYLGSRLVGDKSLCYEIAPGYVAGAFPFLLSVSIGIRVKNIFLKKIFINYPEYDNAYEIACGFLGFVCAFSLYHLGVYLINQVTNKSIMYPKDLYDIAHYARSIEHNTCVPDETDEIREDESMGNDDSFVKKIIGNSRLITGAVCVTAFGFFAYKNKEMLFNLVPSRLYSIFNR